MGKNRNKKDRNIKRDKRFKVSFLLFILCLGFYLLTMNNRFSSAQTIEIAVFVQNLAENHTFGLDHVQNTSQEGVDGRQYCKQGLGYLLTYVPFYLLSKFFAMKWIFFLVTPLATGLSVALIFLVGLELKYKRRTAIILAIAYGLGTMVWAYAKLQFPQPLASLFIVLTIYFLLRYKNKGNKNWLLAAGASMAYAIWVRIDTVPLAFFVILYLLYISLADHSFRNFKKSVPNISKNVLYFSIPFLFLMAIFFYYNYFRFGSILETGYTMGKSGVAGRKLSSIHDFVELFKGLTAFWLMPNQSLFIASPILIFSLLSLKKFWKRFKPECILFYSTFLIYSIFYSLKGFSGFGTPTWGMRYAVPWVSLFLLPIGVYIDDLFKPERIKKEKVFFSILLLSFTFQIVGTITNYQTVQMPLIEREKRENKNITDATLRWRKIRGELAYKPKYSLLLTHLLSVKYGYGYPERVKKLPQGHNYLVDYYLIQNQTGHPLWGIIFILLTTITVSGYFIWKEVRVYKVAVPRQEIKKGRRKRKSKNERRSR